MSAFAAAAHDEDGDEILALREQLERVTAQRDTCLEALKACREGFEFTRQYVGYEALPAIEGWSWFDADQLARAAIARAETPTT